MLVPNKPVKVIHLNCGLIFTTAQVVFITAKMAFIFTSLSTVQIYDFPIFTVVYSPLHRFIWNQHDNQLLVGRSFNSANLVNIRCELSLNDVNHSLSLCVMNALMMMMNVLQKQNSGFHGLRLWTSVQSCSSHRDLV